MMMDDSKLVFDLEEVAYSERSVKGGFGNQINPCRDRGLNSGPPVQKYDTLLLDHKHDSDLVFDDSATNGELFSNPDHHRGRQYRRHHHNGTTDDSRPSQDAVAPVQSPEDADDAGQRIDDAGSFGFFGSLRNLGRRVKKSVYRWFEDGDLEEEAVTEPTDGSISVSTLRKKRSADADQDDQEANRISDVEEDDIIPGAVEQDQDAAADDDQLEEELDEVKKSTRGDIDLSPVEVDDEDYVNEPSGDGGVEGSGSVTDAPYVSSTTGRTLVAPGQPHYYRITFSINEPYQEEFEDRNSDLFQQVAKNLTQAVDALYDSVEGRQSSTLIKIEKTSDPFLCKVTLDLGTLDFYDRQVISSHLENQIITYRKLGSIPVTIDNFTLREFGDRGPGAPPTPQCAAQELPCRSGECLAPSTRCNGVKDCRDGSDEFGCPTNSEPATQPTTPSTPGTTATTISTTTSTSTARSFPIQDKCRADDKVRCADGSIYICRVHICDGNPDCPQGDDEKDCPLDECATGEFMCDLTRCIPASKRCDSQQDCTDGTDEQECPTGDAANLIYVGAARVACRTRDGGKGVPLFPKGGEISLWTEFLATDPGVPCSFPGASKYFCVKRYVWTGSTQPREDK
uniref:SEA domain-containing protein n=1 Tax=Timema tahoe TaxID=61484 RepID=A0A7R9FL58_9NEOP|nr:unnamed protein product [Timema tahoe]